VACLLRFVQRYRAADEKAFMALERQFAALERRKRGLPRGRRCRPHSGRESLHTLIWECEFPSLEAAERARARMDADPDHARLLARQIRYFAEAYAEVYEILDL
jgi:hypothetical protein